MGRQDSFGAAVTSVFDPPTTHIPCDGSLPSSAGETKRTPIQPKGGDGWSHQRAVSIQHAIEAMDEVAEMEECLLQEKFKQQQALIEALVLTQRKLAAARDAALLEQLQMLSVSVTEARPLGKARKRCERFDDDI